MSAVGARRVVADARRWGAWAQTRESLRCRHNWLQLGRFCVVGASGYVINVVAFAVAVGLGARHLTAASAAFMVALANNFFWNRHWTFRGRPARAHTQAVHFTAVSVAAFVFALGVLELLVAIDLPAVAGQAISIAAATPLNFVGNKLWTFRRKETAGCPRSG